MALDISRGMLPSQRTVGGGLGGSKKLTYGFSDYRQVIR